MSPIYEYSCPECKKLFDVLKDREDYNTPEDCPDCKVKAEKKISLSSVKFKGTGWTPYFGKPI